MPTFVTLVKLTPEGAKTIGDGRKRYERYERLVKEAGGRVISAHGLLGQYDIITVSELPDEQTAVRVALSVGVLGTVTTQTMTAVPIKEFFGVDPLSWTPRGLTAMEVVHHLLIDGLRAALRIVLTSTRSSGSGSAARQIRSSSRCLKARWRQALEQ
jgi:uncharacterized protein with GYD domain